MGEPGCAQSVPICGARPLNPHFRRQQSDSLAPSLALQDRGPQSSIVHTVSKLSPSEFPGLVRSAPFLPYLIYENGTVMGHETTTISCSRYAAPPPPSGSQPTTGKAMRSPASQFLSNNLSCAYYRSGVFSDVLAWLANQPCCHMPQGFSILFHQSRWISAGLASSTVAH